MKLTRKFPLVIGAAALFVAAAAATGIAGMHKPLQLYGTEVQQHVQHERNVAAMLYAFKVQVQEWKDTLLRGRDPAKLDKHWKAFQAQEATVDALAADLVHALPDGASKGLVEQFAAAHHQMGAAYRKGFAAFQDAHLDASVGDAAVAGMDREPARLLQEAAKAIAADSAGIAQLANDQASRAVLWSSGLILVACALAVATGMHLGRRFALPLAQAAAAARAVAAGDLSTPIEATGDDEAADLLRALKDMQISLAKVVATVRENAEVVASASDQIAAGTDDLGRRTEMQVTSLEETAASMEKLHDIVEATTRDAARANGLAASASDVASRGGNVVGQVVGTMQGIHDSSRKIVEIISLIDGIAFQTNILALNAAVEAARAGEQGRGFAVVASEVRNLAQRSTAAAREIKDLISDSVDRVGSGSALVQQAGTTMEDVLVAIRELGSIIAEMHTATSDENSGISQVNEAMRMLDRSAQENSALVEESAAATTSLKQMAHELVHVVEGFRLPSAR